jgi:hypothetical protein
MKAVQQFVVGGGGRCDGQSIGGRKLRQARVPAVLRRIVLVRDDELHVDTLAHENPGAPYADIAVTEDDGRRHETARTPTADDTAAESGSSPITSATT